MKPNQLDRYISFCGLDCDTRATQIVTHIQTQLGASKAATPYHAYLSKKLLEKQQRNQDDLHFIHSQLNVLFEFFQEARDLLRLRMLESIEHERC